MHVGTVYEPLSAIRLPPTFGIFTGGLSSQKKIILQRAIVFHSEFENLQGPLSAVLALVFSQTPAKSMQDCQHNS